MAPKMPCHISDGPQDPDDRPLEEHQDPDDAYDLERQREIDLAHAGRRQPQLHVKAGAYTGVNLYSYDQAYWWSTEATAWRMYQKLQRNEP